MAFNKRFAGLQLQEKGANLEQFEKDFLSAHNAYRKQHGSPPLQLSRELCRSAQKWADHLLSIRTLKHSDTEYGENLYYKYSSSYKELPGREPVDDWYSEIKNYNFSRPGFGGNTGHFTQVVWKDTKEVGVGVATDGKGLFFVVGQYNPAGNITNPGYFEKNVLPSGTTPTTNNAINGARSKPSAAIREPESDKPANDRKPVSVTGGRGAEDSQFEKDFLSAHNTYRKKHGAAPLQLNRDLCRSAQQWADHLLAIRTLKHSGTDHGENLYYKYSSSARELPGKEPVDSWYDEIKNYDFGRPGFRSNTGHFTQVVWKDSKEVGVGVATDGNGLFFVVGQYNPAGNITNPGYFEKNVLPSGSAPASASDNDTTGSRWKPTVVIKEPEPERASGDRKPLSGFGRRDGASSFEQEALDAHNAYRRQHGAPPLKLTRELCESSQKWADHLLSINALQHSNTTHGENLWYKWNSSMRDATGSQVVDTWYGEIKDYNFSKPGFQSNTGHFTQVVWKDSKELGIAKAVDGKGMVIAVAQYSPAGNITNPGYFQKNVLPKGTPVSDSGNGSADRGQAATFHPAARAGDSAPYDTRQFAEEFLKANNVYRSRHGAKPLQLNSRVSQDAQKWAEHLLSLKTLKHSETSHGENIWAKSGSPNISVTGQEVADSWYKEEKGYNFSKPGYQQDTGHFTQMVWKASKEVGVGMASSGKGMIIVVAQYNPSGNITNPGFYARNVLPRGSKMTEDDDDEAGFVKDTTVNSVVAIPDKELKAFRKDLLNEHNKYRKLHGAGPLQLSPSLAQEAQNWANQLVGLRALKNSDTQHGENLWYRWGTDTSLPTGKEVAESWYNEIDKYSFPSPGFQSGSGNFTQMVWKSSNQVGFGLSTDDKGMYIVVGFYDPAGNIANKGYFEDNVLPKKK